MMNFIIGVDFDNTIVGYDDVMYDTALAWRLIPEGMTKNKKQIRDAIRQLPEGEIHWQKLQAFIYGESMHKAQLKEGVRDFFQTCRQADISTFIVSHKTKFASMDTQGINLREVALGWMTDQKFFEDDGFGLTQDRIYFESTRPDKVARIGTLGCSHFIDDLEETFLEPTFPSEVEKILYAQETKSASLNDVTQLKHWTQIHEHIFAATQH